MSKHQVITFVCLLKDSIQPIYTSTATTLNQQPSSSVQVFPNPFEQTTSIKVMGNRCPILKLDVYDAQGYLVRQIQNIHGESMFILHRDGLRGGLYFYRIFTNDTLLHTGKLVIQ